MQSEIGNAFLFLQLSWCLFETQRKEKRKGVCVYVYFALLGGNRHFEHMLYATIFQHCFLNHHKFKIV